MWRRRRNRRWSEPPSLGVSSPRFTKVGAAMRLEGTLRAQGDAVLEGCVEGTLEVAGMLVLAPAGRLVGSLSASSAKIDGAVEGPVEVSGRLEVSGNASIEGDVRAGTLDLAEGARLEGKVTVAGSIRRFQDRRQTS